MNYVFQTVPLDQLRLCHGLLTAFSDPIDRHHALKLGASAVIVAELSEQCLLGIAEERRQLAIWTRNQGSTVRLVRYKGASTMRGALNADISNAADRTRSAVPLLSPALAAPPNAPRRAPPGSPLARAARGGGCVDVGALSHRCATGRELSWFCHCYRGAASSRAGSAAMTA